MRPPTMACHWCVEFLEIFGDCESTESIPFISLLAWLLLWLCMEMTSFFSHASAVTVLLLTKMKTKGGSQNNKFEASCQKVPDARKYRQPPSPRAGSDKSSPKYIIISSWYFNVRSKTFMVNKHFIHASSIMRCGHEIKLYNNFFKANTFYREAESFWILWHIMTVEITTRKSNLQLPQSLRILAKVEQYVLRI